VQIYGAGRKSRKRPTLVVGKNPYGKCQFNPLFAIGVFRSGTTLLNSLLNQHSQIAMMYECNVWAYPSMLVKRRFAGNWLERQEFIYKTLSSHHLIFGGSMRGLENVRTPSELYSTFGKLHDAAVWGEKSPAYCSRLRQLAKIYPKSPFILIWRPGIEIYQSVVHLGRKSSYFRRSGMLSRLIFCQEQMIKQSAEIERAGIRVHHVTYSHLVSDAEAACRDICTFLGLEFDKRMLDLDSKDLSKVWKWNYSGDLVPRAIKRQQSPEKVLDLRMQQRLQRFQVRWNRLSGNRFNIQENPAATREPFLLELFYYKMTGRYFHVFDNIKRAFLEFLPLSWLRTYRRGKVWFAAQQMGASSNGTSIRHEFSDNISTILTSCLILAVVALIDVYTPAQVALMPFYMIPSAILALIVSRRWGTTAAIVSALIWSLMKMLEQPELISHYYLQLWNCFMRFSLLQIMVVLLDRIRVEIDSTADT
jgi:thiamine transporter ThiT